MNWYAAHCILYVKFKDGNQNKFPVWENIYLVSGKDEEDALKKAESIAKESEGDSNGTFEWEGRPSTYIFGGVRKLISCGNNGSKPREGDEISYSQYELKNKDDLLKMIQGDEVEVVYEE